MTKITQNRSSKTKSLKGFSLVELLVAMAIIAVLLGLVGFGIATAQRNARDSQRRQAITNIQVTLTEYSTKYNKFPDGDKVVGSTEQISFLPAKGNASPLVVPLTGPQQILASGEVNANGTTYCYESKPKDGGYLLGVLLEGGDWYYNSNVLSGSKECGGNPQSHIKLGS